MQMCVVPSFLVTKTIGLANCSDKARSPLDPASFAPLLAQSLLWQLAGVWVQTDGSLVSCVNGVLDKTTSSHVCGSTAKHIPIFVNGSSQVFSLAQCEVISYSLHQWFQLFWQIRGVHVRVISLFSKSCMPLKWGGRTVFNTPISEPAFIFRVFPVIKIAEWCKHTLYAVIFDDGGCFSYSDASVQCAWLIRFMTGITISGLSGVFSADPIMIPSSV